MPKIKIFKVYAYNCDHCDLEFKKIVGGITDWNEIQKEDLSLLKQYIDKFNAKKSNTEYKYVILEDIEIDKYESTVTELLNYTKNQKKKEVAEYRKVYERDKKRKELMRKNQEEKERKLLAKLKSKYSD